MGRTPPPASPLELAPASNSYLSMKLVLWGEQTAETASRYADIAFIVFAQGTLLVLLDLLSSSSSTGASTDGETKALGADRYFIGSYGEAGEGGGSVGGVAPPPPTSKFSKEEDE